MAQELLTLKEVAERLKLSPSTARYYKDLFAEYMPGVKHGRYMKYEPEAIEIMREISEGFKNNLQQQRIRELLSAKYALNIEEHENELTATTTATTTQQQQSSGEYYKLMAQANSEIYFLRDLVQQLQQDNQELIRELRRPWWKRLFNRE